MIFESNKVSISLILSLLVSLCSAIYLSEDVVIATVEGRVVEEIILFENISGHDLIYIGMSDSISCIWEQKIYDIQEGQLKNISLPVLIGDRYIIDAIPEANAELSTPVIYFMEYHGSNHPDRLYKYLPHSDKIQIFSNFFSGSILTMTRGGFFIYQQEQYGTQYNTFFVVADNILWVRKEKAPLVRPQSSAMEYSTEYTVSNMLILPGRRCPTVVFDQTAYYGFFFDDTANSIIQLDFDCASTQYPKHINYCFNFEATPDVSTISCGEDHLVIGGDGFLAMMMIVDLSYVRFFEHSVIDDTLSSLVIDDATSSHMSTFYSLFNKEDVFYIYRHNEPSPDVADSYNDTLGYGIGVVQSFNFFKYASSEIFLIASGNLSNPYDIHLLRFEVQNCSHVEKCSDCIQEPIYCQWCVSEARCSSVHEVCDTQSISNEFKSMGCPEASSMSPSSIAAGADGILIKFEGYFYTSIFTPSNELKCTLELINGTSVVLPIGNESTNSSIYSLLPALPESEGNTVYVSLNGFNYIGTTFPVDILNCSSTRDCNKCFTVIGCYWNSLENICQRDNGSSGSGCHNVSCCPSLSDLQPKNSGLEEAVVELSMAYSNFSSIGSHDCVFRYGSYEFLSTATFDEAISRVNCSFVSEWGKQVDSDAEWTIELNTTDAISEFSVTASEYFFSYDCPFSKSCASCIGSMKPDCQWCIASQGCEYLSYSCGDGLSFNTSFNCSEVIWTDPDAVYYAVTGGEIFIMGNSFTRPPTSPALNYTVIFSSTSSSQFRESNATWINSTALTAIIPSESFNPETYVSLSVFLGEYGYANSTKDANVHFYDCEAASDECADCIFLLKQGYDDCLWCIYPHGCNYSQSCPSGYEITSCPDVQKYTNPRTGYYLDNTSVIITGSHFVNDSDLGVSMYHAMVYPPDTTSMERNATCRLVSSTELECIMPPFPFAGDVVIDIYFGAHRFTMSQAIFKYQSCDEMTTCNSCADKGYCYVHDFKKCVDSISLNITHDTGKGYGYDDNSLIVIYNDSACPSLDSVNPGHVEFDVADVNITIVGTLYLDYLVLLQNAKCNAFISLHSSEVWWLGDLPLSVINDTAASFTLPKVHGYGEYVSNLNANIKTDCDQEILYANGALELFTCSGIDSCGVCFLSTISKMCGWCFYSSTCGTYESCKKAETWVNENVCPYITSISPEYGSVHGGTTIELEGFFFNITSGDPYDLECYFQSSQETTPADYISEKKISCVSPTCWSCVENTTRTEYVGVHLYNRPFVEQTLPFVYVSCAVPGHILSSCALCTIFHDYRCGWCSNALSAERACLPMSDCDLSLWIANASSCPSIHNVVPQAAISTDETLLTVFGIGFFNASYGSISCFFGYGGGFVTGATITSDTKLTCVSPDVGIVFDDESVNFYLLVGNHSLTADSLSFSFLPEITYSEVLLAYVGAFGAFSVAGFSLLLFLLVLSLAIVISGMIFTYKTVNKFRDRGLVLEKPSFSFFFDESDIRSYSDIPDSEKTAFEFIEYLIVNFETSEECRSILMDILYLKSSKREKIARSIVHLFLDKNHAAIILLFQLLVEKELANQRTENVLFRGDSPMALVFVRYSQLIGFDFLWNFLAYSLNQIAKNYEKKQNPIQSVTDPESSKSPLVSDTHEMDVMQSMSMEIDPNKLESIDPTFISANTYQLLLTLTNIIGRLGSQINLVPYALARFFYIIDTEIKRIDRGDESYTAIGAFFFLRWICIAIVSPHVYGLMEQSPSRETRRMLILIAKVLQNLSNNTLPGEKEKYMEKLNEFVTNNRELLRDQVDIVLENGRSSGDEIDEIVLNINLPKNVATSSIAVIHNAIIENMEALGRSHSRIREIYSEIV